MKRILFFAKHKDQIAANSAVFNSDTNSLTKVDVHSETNNISVELEVLTKVFINESWQCFWTCLDWLDLNNMTIEYFSSITKSSETIYISNLSDNFEVIIFRIVGTVEGRGNLISTVIDTLNSNFEGLIVNHPDAMKYGIRKDYILSLQDEGFPVIETAYFDNSVSYIKLYESCKPNQQYIIKPVTGELSNSLALLENTTFVYNVKAAKEENGEDYVRRKQSAIGGWLLQPLMKDIWEGEYQLVFFGDTFSHGCKKIYEKSSPEMKVPSQKLREITLYEPSQKEKELALSIKAYFENQLLKPIYTFRFDFLKQANGDVRILEFEFLNPGFFIGYIDSDHEKIKIGHNFEREISRLIFK